MSSQYQASGVLFLTRWNRFDNGYRRRIFQLEEPLIKSHRKCVSFSRKMDFTFLKNFQLERNEDDDDPIRLEYDDD